MAEKKKKKLKKLNTKQRLWVENYLSNGFNASLAAKEAGYKSQFRKVGWENTTKPHIKAKIEERLEEAAMGANEVLARITTMAKGFDVAEYVEQEPVYRVDKKGNQYLAGYAMLIDFIKLQKDGLSHLIKRVYTTKYGVGVEWQDPFSSLNLLAKHHKLLIDKFEFEGTIATSTAEAVDALQKAKKELGKK